MESRVLIAEDDSLVARALQQALVKAGYGVDVVADGMAARERLLTGAYGALVTDWMMPELDGIELVRLVRARRQPACVVLITELNIPAARSPTRCSKEPMTSSRSRCSRTMSSGP